jgi:histidinol-phosphate aminotransferase
MKTTRSFAVVRASLAGLALLALSVQASFAQGTPTANDGLIRLGSNENAFGYSPRALAAMTAVLESGNFYNRNNVDDFVQTVAEFEKVTPDFVLPTAGSGPVLLMTAFAYAKPGANVVTTAPGYTQLTRTFLDMGGEVKYVPVGADYGQDLAAMSRAIDANTTIVYICNPNNPTGVLADPAELRRFVMSIPRDVLVFVDEAYLELSTGGLAANSMAPLVKARQNLIISRTFSKSHGMAGIRAGYGLANPAVLANLRKFYQGGPTFVSAVGAREALLDTEFMAGNAKKYQDVRDYVAAEFDRMGITYAKPEGAFIWFKSAMNGRSLVATTENGRTKVWRW